MTLSYVTVISLLLLLYHPNLTLSDTCQDNDITCDYCIKQEDFNTGTVRIKESGKYCLSTNIVINPNPVRDNNDNPSTPYHWFPNDEESYPGCINLSDGGYALGYFAGISIETSNVELDLKHHAIAMSKEFYIQQRFFSLIEIGNTPFVTGQGPANFGTSISVSNINIHDGVLALSSHHGIHGNDVNDIIIENLRIFDFEVAGIQLNGFNGAELKNLIIGPSSHDIPVCGYYSNAKYLSYALSKLVDKMGSLSDNTTVTFSGNRIKSIREVYNDLLFSMDIGFKYAMDILEEDDLNNELYDISVGLYSNPMRLPDGSSLYGLVFHSSGVATGGHGQGTNEQGMGDNLVIENVKIQDLKLNVNDVPGVYFDECDNNYQTKTVLKGPFGDIMDLRWMVGGWDNAQIIDLGDDFTSLTYIGNPLSDSQIVLSRYGNEYGFNYGSITSSHFLSWALDSYNDNSYDGLPVCTSFVCNGDAMYHTNKGVMGIRFDLIENIELTNVMIKRLINKSPLGSYACSNYSGPHDGGNRYQLVEEGYLGTDVKGIVVNGGNIIFDGYNNVIQKLISYNGDVIGLHLINNVNILFDYVYKSEVSDTEDKSNSDTDTEDDRSYLHIKELCPGREITFALLAELMVDQKYPYPNNFYACNIKLESDTDIITPYPPNGIDNVWCLDYVPDDIDNVLSNLLPVDVKLYNQDNMIDVGLPSNPVPNPDTTDLSADSVPIIIPVNKHNDDKNNNDKNNNELPENLIKYNHNRIYVYFIIGVLCIITVVGVVFTFIMKCGQAIMNENIKSNAKRFKLYSKANIGSDDDESDSADDEPINV